MRLHVAFAFLSLSLVFPSFADARSFRTAQVPNNEWSCGLCHLSSRGGGPRTGFGEQVNDTLAEQSASADVNWAALAELDGDGDGYSNGYELGDPQGTWMIGDPNPEGAVYNPADRDSSPCGDGVLDEQEECDTTELNGAQCSDEGYGPGTVTCSSLCRLDFSQCEGFSLPNNSNNGGTNNATNNGETNNATNNGSTNNATNDGDTNNATNQGDTNNQTDPDDEMMDPMGSDDEGCSTATGSASSSVAWMLLLGLFFLRRRQSSTN